ncbi:MAG TPA: histidinol-phosphate transaminase [Acidothermaceae bacterium]|nr:histidinol-phosphate transaminase [Acidothermaceae bacterium]
MTEFDGLPIRDDLRGETPYGAPQLDVAVALNVNENPYPPSPSMISDVAAAVAAVTGQLNRYPDREASALRADLAGYLARFEGVSFDPSLVWAANGSNEVMHQLLLAFGGPGRTVLGFSPTYSMYPQYCRDTFTNYVTEPREADFSLDPEVAVKAVRSHRPVVTLLTSPNNPTGTALPIDTAEAVLEAASEHGGLVVVDEAYAEFRRPGTPSALGLLERHKNLVVTRTMSKAFAYAGARVGYLVADPAIVDAVRIVRLPYHLSAVTQVVATVALRHADELLAQVAALRAERDACVEWLRANGFSVADSDANFVLFGLFDDRHAIWQGLLDRGVLIRETGPSEWLRVSVGTPAEMTAFKNALLEVTRG